MLRILALAALFAAFSDAAALSRFEVTRRDDGALSLDVDDALAIDVAREIGRVAGLQVRGLERLGDIHVTLRFERLDPRSALALVATSAGTELHGSGSAGFRFGALIDVPEARDELERARLARAAGDATALATALDALIVRVDATPDLQAYLPDLLAERAAVAEQRGEDRLAVALIDRELALRDAVADADGGTESAWRLVTLQRRAGRFELAEPGFARIVAAEQNDGTTSVEQRVFTLRLAAANLVAQGKLAEASEFATQAIVLAEEARDPGASLVPALAQRAAIAVVLGNASVAIADWTRAVQLREAVLGVETTSVSAAYRELAFLARFDGNFDGAQGFDANVRLALDEVEAWAERPHEGVDAELWPELDAALQGALAAIDPADARSAPRRNELVRLRAAVDEAFGNRTNTARKLATTRSAE